MASLWEHTRDERNPEQLFSARSSQAFPYEWNLCARILGGLGDPAFALNSECRLTYCNRVAERFYGFSLSDMRGLPIDALTACDLEGTLRLIADSEAIGSDDVSVVRVSQQTPDGLSIEVEVTVI